MSEVSRETRPAHPPLGPHVPRIATPTAVCMVDVRDGAGASRPQAHRHSRAERGHTQHLRHTHTLQMPHRSCVCALCKLQLEPQLPHLTRHARVLAGLSAYATRACSHTTSHTSSRVRAATNRATATASSTHTHRGLPCICVSGRVLTVTKRDANLELRVPSNRTRMTPNHLQGQRPDCLRHSCIPTPPPPPHTTRATYTHDAVPLRIAYDRHLCGVRCET